MRGQARWKRFTDGTSRLRGLLMAARAPARRHWLFTIVLCAGLSLRILTQVAYSPALVYIDSYRYLHGDSSLDPLGYLALLWPLQRTGGLAAVAAGQHILGLGMALSLYAVLLRRGMWRWAAALAAAPVLLDGYQLQAEQTIMPDVLFEALIVAGLALLLWRRNPAAWQVGLAGLALGVAVDVRQVGAVLILPAVAFLLVCAIRGRRLADSALLTVGSMIPVLIYLVVQFAVSGHFTFTQRNSYVFYGRAAAAADCATLRLPPDERSLCPSPQVVGTMGIDGLVGDPAGPLLSYQPPPGRTLGAMADRFERAVVMQQPVAVVDAIHRDFIKLFALTRNTAPGDMPISRWQFQTTYPTYPPLITLGYVASIRPGGGQPSVIRPLAEVLRDYQLHGGYTPGPLLAVAALAGLAGSCMLGGRRREHTATATACLLTTTMAIILLLASDAYEFSWRYQLPALVLLPPAGILGAAAIATAMRSAAPKRAGAPGLNDLPVRRDGQPDLVGARAKTRRPGWSAPDHVRHRQARGQEFESP
jgi:4-amino-4-deoxy-L-arabinose transferase-like glycosyltransferase